MEQPKNLKLTVEAWAKIVIEHWEDRIMKLNIGHSEQLIDSLVYDLRAAGPDVLQEVTFTFNYYGKFVDMGVGKGVKLGDAYEQARSARGKQRRPKKWYSKTFFFEVEKLRYFLAEHFAKQAMFVIRENLDDNALRHKRH